VNSALVQANWLIGKQIVDAEQGGKTRATYGEQLLEMISRNLSAEYGSGFSLSAVKYMRLFYLVYPRLLPIRHAVRDESHVETVESEILTQCVTFLSQRRSRDGRRDDLPS
jgi:DUF1016 N-terminal domain